MAPSRALHALNIKIICANSNNAFLLSFIADYNARFAKPPANSKNLHRPMASRETLEDAFIWRVGRTLSRALTLRYDQVMFILDPTEEAQHAIGKQVEVLDYPDGRLAIRYKGTDRPYVPRHSIRRR